MLRILLMISIFSYFNSFSQAKEEKIASMTISYAGDSLIAQKYELIIKGKRIYFITPVVNYLHVNGAKYKRRVKINKDKRDQIFSLVGKLTWKNLEQTKNKVTGDRCYFIETFSTGHLIDNYKVPGDLLPSDFEVLYNTLSEGK
jgi:hypothetical protein